VFRALLEEDPGGIIGVVPEREASVLAHVRHVPVVAATGARLEIVAVLIDVVARRLIAYTGSGGGRWARERRGRLAAASPVRYPATLGQPTGSPALAMRATSF
jgi:hypothetical protein